MGVQFINNGQPVDPDTGEPIYGPRGPINVDPNGWPSGTESWADSYTQQANGPWGPQRSIGSPSGTTLYSTPFGKPSGMPWWLSLPLSVLRNNPEAAAITTAAGVMAPTPAETGELPRKYWPPTNTTPGAMQWPDSTSLPTGLPQMPPSSSPGFDVGGPNWNVQHSNSGYGGMPPDAFTVNAAPTGPRTPAAAAPGGAGPLSRNRARPSAPITPANVNLGMGSPFVPIDRPNMDPTQRGSPHASVPQMTALDLSKLFGGGQAAAARPGPLANVPSAAAQPVSATRRNVTTKAPWGYGPLQKGRSWPQGPDYSDIPVGYHSGYE
jgi:hypothetical protein